MVEADGGSFFATYIFIYHDTTKVPKEWVSLAYRAVSKLSLVLVSPATRNNFSRKRLERGVYSLHFSSVAKQLHEF